MGSSKYSYNSDDYSHEKDFKKDKYEYKEEDEIKEIRSNEGEIAGIPSSSGFPFFTFFIVFTITLGLLFFIMGVNPFNIPTLIFNATASINNSFNNYDNVSDPTSLEAFAGTYMNLVLVFVCIMITFSIVIVIINSFHSTLGGVTTY